MKTVFISVDLHINKEGNRIYENKLHQCFKL